jgi:iron(III) transport system ATP-binding protein
VSAAAIEFRHVSKRFGEVRAVDDVSFAIAPGTLVTLLGPSGCGKTTTLRLIAGLDFATAGDILVGGVEVSGRSPAERNVSMVFQGDALFAHMTVRENVAYGVRVAGRSRAEAAERAQAMLDTVGLGGLGDRLPSELSAGQRQRAAVARALVLEPTVLLFDEPLAHLDAGLRRHLRDEIRGLQQRLRLTFVYVTHDQAEAMAVSDRIIVMNRAVVAQDGTPRELYESPASEFVARFMGEANLLEGRLDARDGDTGVVHLGPLRLRLPHRGQPPGPVAVAVRPEAVAVGPKGPGTLPATVRRAAYLGAVVEYTLATEIGELFVTDRDACAPLAPGEAVGLTLLDRGVVILPRGVPCHLHDEGATA